LSCCAVCEYQIVTLTINTANLRLTLSSYQSTMECASIQTIRTYTYCFVCRLRPIRPPPFVGYSECDAPLANLTSNL